MSDFKNEFQLSGSDINLRTGALLPQLADKSIKISGTLPAPFQFAEGKVLNDVECHLLIFKDKGVLELHVQDTNPHTEHVIVGMLRRDSVLQQFGLNTEKRWSIGDFLKFIKTMRFYFPNKAEHLKLVESLKTWSVKVTAVLKEHQDNSGNSMFMLEKKVSDVELINSFTIECAIFQGYPKQKIKVEIGLDPKSVAVDLYLISDELIELEDATRDKIMDEEIEKFKEYEFSKVVVS